jgi:hypothetical protein
MKANNANRSTNNLSEIQTVKPDMLGFRTLVISLIAILLSGLSDFGQQALAADGTQVIHMQSGEVALELIGQVNNLATPAPLGSSIQYGYVSALNGVGQVFSGSPQNETTARFTFYTEVNTSRVTSHGPFAIIIREGTTTVYLNTLPASFGTPDSFRSGTPVQVSAIHQQVIVDTVEKTFAVMNVNTITSSPRFLLDGQMVKVGVPGEGFRTSLQGVLFVRSGGTPPPTGHFAGYAVGIPGGNQNEL